MKYPNRICSLVLAAAGIAASSLAGSASAQTAFTYQGVLSESGSPITGLESIRFRIYDAQTGGTLIGETTQNVDVADGVFSTQLNFGPLNTIDPSTAWLELAVDTGSGYEILGRQQITSAPFATNTRGMEVSANASTITFPLGSDAELRFFEDDCCPGITGDSTVLGMPGHILRLRSDLEIHNTGTDAGSLDVRDGSGNARIKLVNEAHFDATNRIVFNGASGEPSYLTAGDVGIGTDNPLAKLHVREGSTGATPNSNAVLVVEGTSGFATWINVLGQVNEEVGILLGHSQSSSDGALVWNDSNDHLQLRAGGSTQMVVEGNGNVGIGNTSPSAKLDVTTSGNFLGIQSRGTNAAFTLDNTDDANTRWTMSASANDTIVIRDTFDAKDVLRLQRAPLHELQLISPSSQLPRAVMGESATRADCGRIFTLDNTFTIGSMMDFQADGTAFVQTDEYFVNSDERLKENIETLSDPIETVKALRGVTYDRIDGSSYDEIGFIAQEVEKVLPQLVKTDSEGMKSVAYDRMTALLVEVVKEQQAQIESLQNQRSMTGASLIWPALIGGGLVGGIALARRRQSNA